MYNCMSYTGRKSRHLFHILVCQPVQLGQTGGSKVVDRKKEAFRWKEVVDVDPQFVFSPDFRLLDPFQALLESVFDE